MAGRALHRRRHPHHGGGDPGGRRRRAASAPSPGCADEALRQGTTTIEIKSGYGLTVGRRGSAACASPRRSPPRPPSSGAHVVPPEYDGRPDDYVELVCGDDAGGRRAVRPVGRRVLRAGRVRRRPVPGGPRRPGIAAGLPPAPARQPARPGPRRPARGRAGRGQRRPLHPPDRRRRRGAGRLVHGGHPAARGGVLHPVALPGRARGCSTPAPRSRWPPTATPARRTRRRCRSASRWPCARWG